MPAQTPDEAADELDDLATAPLSSSNDQGSTTERTAGDVASLRNQAKAERADANSNGQGGKKSGWRFTRPATYIPPGTI